MKFAVIYKEKTHIPGDERSRTNPGHGYPAHTVTRDIIETFDCREEWESWIKKNIDRGKFKAITFEEVEVEKEVSIKVG